MKTVTTEQLRNMAGQEGLVLQGCGGDPQEWLDGINDLFTREGILKNGSKFQDAMIFKHDGLTNILFPFEGVDLSVGRLVVWRLQSHAQFGGTWLSDYVPNRLGGFAAGPQAQDKPDCPLIGKDGNIFNLMGIAARTLRENGLDDQAGEMRERIMGGGCQSYEAALSIIGEYVNITEAQEQDMSMGGMGGMA